MISGQDILGRVERVFPSAPRRYSFPLTYIDLVHPDYAEEDDERETQLAGWLELSVSELRATCNRLYLRLEPRLPAEPDQRPPDRGEFWLKALDVGAPGPGHTPAAATATGPRIVHFYGFKGGQGRSTLLALFAKAMAADGWRLLALDLDAEAPSLDLLLQTPADRAAQTLIGLRAEIPIEPLRAYTPPGASGYVDLLPFRPRPREFDLDAAALTMEMGLYPPSQVGLVGRLAPQISAYDVVLVDHRTGLAPTVLPWVTHLPGAVCVLARMDGQWRHAEAAIGALWKASAPPYGALLSLAPPHVGVAELVATKLGDAETLLQCLAEAIDPDAQTLGAEHMGPRWIVFPYDNALDGGRVPELAAVGGDTRAAVKALRAVLEVEGAAVRGPAEPGLGSHSGARDRSTLVETDALRELSAPNTKDYIIGRKGTGKSRLLRTLALRGKGEALLVATEEEDELGFGVLSGHVTLFDHPAKGVEPTALWWALLAAALEGEDTERERLTRAFDLLVTIASPLDRLLVLVRNAAERRTFLVDGLETAFASASTTTYVDALFRVMNVIRGTPELRDRIRIQAFIRPDLAQRGYENFEQQTEGRRLDLIWDTKAILNFALSRILSIPWYQTVLPAAVARIGEASRDLGMGECSVERCDELMACIFPEKLGRFNVLTSTFLRTYFSDAPQGNTGFYPRLYGEFLDQIGKIAVVETGRSAVRDARLSGWVVERAHEQATNGFLWSGLKVELSWMLMDRDSDKLDRLLRELQGEVTPFAPDRLRERLVVRTGLTDAYIRNAFDAMRQVGVFEKRPGHADQWRAGRLFKTALGMRYTRSQATQDDGHAGPANEASKSG